MNNEQQPPGGPPEQPPNIPNHQLVNPEAVQLMLNQIAGVGNNPNNGARVQQELLEMLLQQQQQRIQQQPQAQALALGLANFDQQHVQQAQQINANDVLMFLQNQHPQQYALLQNPQMQLHLQQLRAQEEQRIRAEEEQRIRAQEEQRIRAQEEQRRAQEEQRIRAEEEQRLQIIREQQIQQVAQVQLQMNPQQLQLLAQLLGQQQLLHQQAQAQMAAQVAQVPQVPQVSPAAPQYQLPHTYQVAPQHSPAQVSGQQQIPAGVALSSVENMIAQEAARVPSQAQQPQLPAPIVQQATQQQNNVNQLVQMRLQQQRLEEQQRQEQRRLRQEQIEVIRNEQRIQTARMEQEHLLRVQRQREQEQQQQRQQQLLREQMHHQQQQQNEHVEPQESAMQADPPQAVAPPAARARSPNRGNLRGHPRRPRQGPRRQRQPQADGPPRVDEALAYLRVIKSTFATDVPVYHRFLEIMKNFRAQRIETPDVIEQVAELLYESPELVLGFNTFLPTGFHISIAEEGRYVFTAPQSQPRVLLTPEERRNLVANRQEATAAVAPGPARGANGGGEQGSRDDDVPMDEDPAEEDNEENKEGGESESEGDDRQDEQAEDQEPLVEEVIPDDDQSDDDEEPAITAKGEISADMARHTLKVAELLKTSFSARPQKIVDFVTFLQLFLLDSEYYAPRKRMRREAESERKSDDGTERNQPGPAPPQSEASQDEERMDVDGENVEAPRKVVEAGEEQSEEEQRKAERAIERTSSDHIVSMLAQICIGEPILLAAIIDYLPYLRELIQDASEDIVQKIRDILLFSATHNRLDLPEDKRLSKEQIDMELVKLMETCKMGTKKGEKLRIKRANQPEKEGDKQCLVTFNKSYRILYERLKTRLSPHQLRHLVTCLNMYENMDLSKEGLAKELPKIIGVSGSEVEKAILKLLGVNTDPANLPENDVDAVMRRDLPAIQPKRGLRDQKMLQQVKNVEAATVCTLGPSYRLLNNTKKVECSGRVELPQDLKDVLNDKWTSYPSWSSEDTGTQATKKSNLEEFHFKTEDERYELDIIVDSNRTILEELNKTLRDYEALSDPDKKHFKLNDVLNCSSRATFLRVMTKVFTNSVYEVIRAAQQNVHLGLATIIESLTERDTSWTHFQQETNKAWRDALEKQLANSMTLLNNQQKNYDLKAFKSKPLVNGIEQICEDKKNVNDLSAHITLEYTPEPKSYRDVNEVAEHFFHELPGGKTDKDRTKVIIFKILMEWLCQPGQNVQVSLDNEEIYKFQGDLTEDENMLNLLNMDGRRLRYGNITVLPSSGPSTSDPSDPNDNAAEKFRKHLFEKKRRVIYGDDNVYMLIRYHHMLLDRFTKILATQASYSQEYLDNQNKYKKWGEGIGASMHGRKVLEENVIQRREAVNEIRNIRSSPSSYYESAIRELKQLGKSQSDMSAMDEAIKHLFPGDVVLFQSIDKLFLSFAKNVHLAACADEKENPIKLYLQYRQRMMNAENEEQLKVVEQEYAQSAEESLRGKNTYRFEFIDGNVPTMNIWVIPREEKESPDEDEDEDGNDLGKDDDEAGKDEQDGGKDDDVSKEEGDEGYDNDEDMPPASNDDGDDDEDDEESSESPSMGEDPEAPSELEDVKIEESDIKEEDKDAIEQTGCDMQTAFNGEYKNDEFVSLESTPGVFHRIYMQCVKDNHIWMPRHKLSPRQYNKNLDVCEKAMRKYDYERMNRTRRTRIRRTERVMERKHGNTSWHPCFQLPFVPLAHI